MASISNNNIAEAIYLASKEKSQTEQPLFFKKVIQFLTRRKLLSKAPDILLCLNKIINKREGRIETRISSAKKIDEKTNKELSHILTKKYSVKEINLIENLDEKLLGGIKIEINDEVINMTLRNKIGQLQEYLTKSV
jgi:F0F1-type ATP synthase delta subunit